MPVIPARYIAQLQELRIYSGLHQGEYAEPVDIDRRRGALGDSCVLIEPVRAGLLGTDGHTALKLWLAGMSVGHEQRQQLMRDEHIDQPVAQLWEMVDGLLNRNPEPRKRNGKSV